MTRIFCKMFLHRKGPARLDLIVLILVTGTSFSTAKVLSPQYSWSLQRCHMKLPVKLPTHTGRKEDIEEMLLLFLSMRLFDTARRHTLFPKRLKATK